MSVPLTRRNLLFEKGKLLLSVAGVAVALALIFLLIGFRDGLYATLTAYVDNMDADLIVAQSGVKGLFASNSAVPLSIHDKVASTAGATEAGHIIVADVIFAQGDTKTPVLLVGYDPETLFGSPWKLGEGKLISGDDQILLDSWLAQRAGVEVGDTVDLVGQQFTVMGLTRETTSWMSPYVFVSLDAAERALGLTNTVSYHLLRLPSQADVTSVARQIERQTPGVEAMTPQAIANADRRVLATIMDTPINVMLVVGVAIGIAVMGLTTYTAVTDRAREYGVLKAIGTGDRRLIRLVIVETCYRAGIGYLIGVSFSYLAAELIMAVWPQFTIVLSWEAVAQVALLALLMMLTSALLPVRRLNRIDPMLVFKA